MESERRKVYVEVNVTHRPDGTARPNFIKFENDEKYEIGSGSFRLLIGDLYDLYCYHFSLTRRLAEAADEKALLKIQKSVSGYERRMKRLCRRWGLPTDDTPWAYDTMEKSIRERMLHE